jgi:hypothetical protein
MHVTKTSDIALLAGLSIRKTSIMPTIAIVGAGLGLGLSM